MLQVGESFRFFFSAATVRAKVNEIDADTGWIAVSVDKVGDYWMNLATVSGIQTESEAKKAEEAAKAAKKG
jgi:hypothetical protein